MAKKEHRRRLHICFDFFSGGFGDHRCSFLRMYLWSVGTHVCACLFGNLGVFLMNGNRNVRDGCFIEMSRGLDATVKI